MHVPWELDRVLYEQIDSVFDFQSAGRMCRVQVVSKLSIMNGIRNYTAAECLAHCPGFKPGVCLSGSVSVFVSVSLSVSVYAGVCLRADGAIMSFSQQFFVLANHRG
jgi:hypothetical protein